MAASNYFDAMGSWGYCKTCRRNVLLTDEGKTDHHHSYTSTGSKQSLCPGVGSEPIEAGKETTE